MGLLISIITLILVFQAYGFDVNRKTGEVIQNGLIYIDSAPDNAVVSFNGQEQKSKTNSRYSLPSGDYQLKITKNGYRDWSRSFTLGGSNVERFYYPMLIPKDIKTTVLQTNESTPSLFTESPDRKWLLSARAGSFVDFTEYDLGSVTNSKRTPTSRQFSIPSGILTQGVSQSYELVEWSTDNKHVLLKHLYDGKAEFVVLSRDQPETSFNINALLGFNPDKIVLRDKKFDQWYVYNQQGGILQSADNKKTVKQLLANVTAFKSHDSDTILYSQTVDGSATQRVSLSQGKDSYLIRDNVAPGSIALDIAQFDSKWFLQVGVDADQKTYIYRNPQDVLNKKDGTKLTPFTVLRTHGSMTAVTFSQNTRFLATQSGQHFEVYDAEKDDIYRFDVTQQFTPGTKVTWMDGSRLVGYSASTVIIFDFDGSNLQKLVDVQTTQGTLFDRDYTVLYALNPKNELFSGDLRLAEDR